MHLQLMKVMLSKAMSPVKLVPRTPSNTTYIHPQLFHNHKHLNSSPYLIIAGGVNTDCVVVPLVTLITALRPYRRHIPTVRRFAHVYIQRTHRGAVHVVKEVQLARAAGARRQKPGRHQPSSVSCRQCPTCLNIGICTCNVKSTDITTSKLERVDANLLLTHRHWDRY